MWSGGATTWRQSSCSTSLPWPQRGLPRSGTTDRPTRLTAAEKLLSGKAITDALLQQAAEAAREVQIEGDLHGSAAYKKQLIGVYLKRAVNEARNASH